MPGISLHYAYGPHESLGAAPKTVDNDAAAVAQQLSDAQLQLNFALQVSGTAFSDNRPILMKTPQYSASLRSTAARRIKSAQSGLTDAITQMQTAAIAAQKLADASAALL
jgi:hypothetical protein